MKNEIENLIKKIAIRDILIQLNNAKLEGLIIPNEVFEIIKKVEADYEVDPVIINELTEKN
jgi:hypothetical protein